MLKGDSSLTQALLKARTKEREQMEIIAQPYQGEDDYARIRTLLQEIYAIGGPPVCCSVGDLDWWRFNYENPNAALATARLWQKADGTLIGVAWPEDNEVNLFVHPYHSDFNEDMLEWAEAWCLKSGADEVGHLELRVWSFETDESQNAVLHRRGYERTDFYLYYRIRSLDEPIPELSLPAGYSIRHMRGEEDVNPRAAVHRDAFAPYTSMTANKYRTIMNAPTYRPELDLVVVAEDSSFSSFCIVWYDEKNQFGVFEPVGCHPQHRRRGLTKALMFEGLRRLKHLGATVASVGSVGSDVPSNRLYESLGFRKIDHDYLWVKIL